VSVHVADVRLAFDGVFCSLPPLPVASPVPLARSLPPVFPRALRQATDKWWFSRLQNRLPLAALAVPIASGVTYQEATLLGWLQSFQALQPLVSTTVFTDSPVARAAAAQAGLRVDSGEGLSVLEMADRMARSGGWRGSDASVAFWGVVNVGVAFPDAGMLIDTLYGVAADMREDRVPTKSALVARSREVKSLNEGRSLLERCLSSPADSLARKAALTEITELEFEPMLAHSMALVTSAMLGALPRQASTPDHVASMVRALAQDGRLRGLDQGAGSEIAGRVASFNNAVVLDVTDTVVVMKTFPLEVDSPVEGFALTRSGDVILPISTDETEFATFLEDLEKESDVPQSLPSSHVVSVWRGSEVLEQEEEEEQPLGPSPSPQSPSTPASARKGPLISVFTTLMVRPSQDEHGEQKFMIQRNTLMALKLLEPEVELTVFTDSERTKKLCDELSVTCSGRFETNSHGTPYLKSMFRSIERSTQAPMYGFFNADILFDDSLLQSVRALLSAIEAKKLKPHVLMIGRRTNFDMPIPFSRLSPWAINTVADLSVVKRMASRGRLFQTDAQDYFFVTRGTFNWDKMPNFVIGRVAYDNWIVDHAYHIHVDRVDATSTLHAVHQTGTDGNKAGHIARPDKEWNLALVDQQGGGYDHGHTYHANWETKWRGRGERSIIFRHRGKWN
jgi:hypothetical protein